MTVRVCVEPGCPALTRRTRCADHERAKDKARGTRQERGYDAAHDRLRAQYQHRMDEGETFTCWRCAERGVVTVLDPTRWQLGHDDSDRDKYRGPECIPCNTATAGRRNA